MTCKDCIHYDVCAVKSKMHSTLQFKKGKRVTTDFFEDVEKRCKHFSDRSRYIELPCKVGDMIYYISFGKIYAGKCHCVSVHNEVQIHFYDFDGDNATLCAKDIFLTHEEAEKALKEKRCE